MFVSVSLSDRSSWPAKLSCVLCCFEYAALATSLQVRLFLESFLTNFFADSPQHFMFMICFSIFEEAFLLLFN